MKSARIILLATLASLAFGSGCTHVAKSQNRVATKLEEHSRAFTTAVVDALQLQPTDQRDPFTATALRLAQFDQRIEGISVKPIAVADLIDSSATNQPAHQTAIADLSDRDDEVRELLAKQRRNEERLLSFGERFERERNAQRLTWFKRGTVAVLVIGAFVTLFVFFPALLPVAGHLIAWCVGRFPALAGGAGVVSVKAFDALVKAIEQTRSNTAAGPERFGNQAVQTNFADGLLQNLSREMDAAHKALVRSRRNALQLDR